MSNDPSKPERNEKDPFEREQGIIIECIHCTILYPNENRPNCPECKGAKSYFIPAQMMDKQSSIRYIITELIKILANQENLKDFDNTESLPVDTLDIMRNNLFNLLKNIVIYNFNVKNICKDLILDIDKQLKIQQS